MKNVKRRNKLMCEIASSLDENVVCSHCSYFKTVNQIFMRSEWFRENYSKERIPENCHEQNILYQDLNQLALKNLIFFSCNSGEQDRVGQKRYNTDPTTWTIGLYKDGLEQAIEYNKSILTKAYEKQPMTF